MPATAVELGVGDRFDIDENLNGGADYLARLFSTGGDGPACRHIRGKPYHPVDVLEAWARGRIRELRTTATSRRAKRRG